MNSTVWRRIGSDTDGDLVLAVDMDGSTRSGATFHNLAATLDDDCDFRLPLMPDTATLESGGLVEMWSSDIDQWAAGVRAISGYCSGSLFALSLANRVEQACGSRPEVILFDPERPTTEAFHRDVVQGLAGMSALDPAERESYVQQAQRIVLEHETAFEPCVYSLIELYGAACTANFEQLGVGPDIAAELASAFAAYGFYLLDASRIGPDELQWTNVTALLSIDAKTDGFDCTQIQIDVDKSELLRCEAAATQFRELWERRAS